MGKALYTLYGLHLQLPRRLNMEVGAKINPDTDVCPIRNNDALSSYKKEIPSNPMGSPFL